MAEHREQVDKRMMQQINRRVLIPLLIDLGARYLVKPYMGKYDDEDKVLPSGALAISATETSATALPSITLASTTLTARCATGKTYQRVEDSGIQRVVRSSTITAWCRMTKRSPREDCVVRGNVQPD